MDVSSSANLTVETQNRHTCLLANIDDTSAPSLSWGIKVKGKRAKRKWQSKLNELQALIARDRENSLLLGTILQNAIAAETAMQVDSKSWACLGDWGQEDGVPLTPAWSTTEYNTVL